MRGYQEVAFRTAYLITGDASEAEEATQEAFVTIEVSLLRLYDRAENVEEALSIQRELTTVRGEIELVQGRIKYLDQRSAYSLLMPETFCLCRDSYVGGSRTAPTGNPF